MVQRLDIVYERLEVDKIKRGERRQAKFAEIGKRIAVLDGKIADHEKKLAALLKRAKKIDANLNKLRAILESES